MTRLLLISVQLSLAGQDVEERWMHNLLLEQVTDEWGRLSCC